MLNKLSQSLLTDYEKHFDNTNTTFDFIFTEELLSSRVLSITTSLQFSSTNKCNLYIIPFYSLTRSKENILLNPAIGEILLSFG